MFTSLLMLSFVFKLIQSIVWINSPHHCFTTSNHEEKFKGAEAKTQSEYKNKCGLFSSSTMEVDQKCHHSGTIQDDEGGSRILVLTEQTWELPL